MHSERKREREREREKEILGTSTTCSAIGKSRNRKVSVTSPTICGTRRSRICTNGQTEPGSSMTCRTTLSCLPATSDRGAGRPPPGSSSRLKSSGWGVGASGSSPCCSARAPTPRPWPSSVRKLGQGHGDGHPLMPQHGAEPSLSPPLGRFPSRCQRHPWSTT